MRPARIWRSGREHEEPGHYREVIRDYPPLTREAEHGLKVRGRMGELGWDIVHNRLAQQSPSTLEVLGKRWSISRERVRQVESKTKRLLQRHLKGFAGVGLPVASN